MHLFVDISGHGFGHLAIIGPVLGELAGRQPGLRLTVRSTLPEARLRERIAPPFRHIAGGTDFGFVQRDAMHVERAASADAYRAAHADWPRRVAEEAAFLAARQADCVLTSVSYLPLAGARRAGIPCAALCSLNWADLFRHFFGGEGWAAAIHDEMLAAYRAADLFLRVTPAMPMTDLPNRREVGPIARLGARHDLRLGADKTILIALGGIAHRLPVEDWPRLPGLRWLVPAAWQCDHPAALAWESLGLDFTDLLCSVDAVVTKPGYGTFAEAACNGTPLLYTRRDDWPEQDCLITWLQKHGRSGEIDAADLLAGKLGDALDRLWQQSPPSRPKADGAAQAAAYIAALAGRSSRQGNASR